jgi:hypothetical protein
MFKEILLLSDFSLNVGVRKHETKGEIPNEKK